MASDILVDSNVFIDLLRRGKDPAHHLIEWAANRNLATCGIVRLEVLRGITSPKSHRNNSAFFDVLIQIPTTDQLLHEAADLAWRLDRQGIVIPSSDVVIAACALRIGAAVLTSDLHFSRIACLEVIAPPAEWSME